MKIHIKIFLAVCSIFVYTISLQGQSTDKNYVKSSEMLTGNILTIDQVNQLSGNQIRKSITYFDGLGRPVQSIIEGKSPGTNDMVTITEYDEYGRVVYSYLPFTKANNTGNYIDNAKNELLNFYNAPPVGVPATNLPYGETRYDNSPLNRVFETSLPGEGYQISSNHTKKIDYGTNVNNEVVLFDVNMAGDILKNGFYLPNKLHVVTTTDENGISSKVYTNLKGNQVLKRVITSEGNFDTYYIYNIHNLLTCVIMPQADISNNVFNDYKNAFLYKYDNRKRQVEKSVPGKGTVYYVYDKLDRLVAEQDAVMRDGRTPYWKFYKYDKLNRLIIEGKYFSWKSRANLQSEYNNLNILYEEKAPGSNGGNWGYTNQMFPTSSTEIEQVTYYDDYDFDSDGNSEFNTYYQQQFSDPATQQVKGQVTGKKYLNDEVKFLTTEVYYYDGYYRMVQNNKFFDNDQNELFCTGNLYSFGGVVLKTNYKYNAMSALTLEYSFLYTYDNNWRNTGYSLLSGNSTNPLVSQSYSETGNLLSKYFTSQTGGSLYSLNYRYNPRGWLTSINELNNNFANMIFGLKLYYENPPPEATGIAGPQYNGNISVMKWFTKDEELTPRINAYGFSYDDLNRLKSAVFYNTDGNGASNPYPTYTNDATKLKDYLVGISTVDNITYDKNGNILSLNRSIRTENACLIFDKLNYFYNGNQLIAVDDDINRQSRLFDFYDNGHKYATSNNTEFFYDDNGNMTEDVNRGLHIDYVKELNLPKTISFEEGYIENQYLYNGTKYAKREFDADGNLQSEEKYFDNLIIKNGQPFKILHPEGYLNLQAGASNQMFNYFIKDHLGNVRLVLSETSDNNPVVVQASGYYPFGMLFQNEQVQAAQGTGANRYLYNGKEIQKMPGGWYDYGKRFYDGILGRFTGVDPLADTFAFVTPYNYAENSPIANVDLWGLQAVPFQGVMGTFDKTGYSKMVDRQNKAIEQIDYVGVSYSGNAFVGGGGGGDINLAYVKGDGVFVNFTGKTGPGGDVSHGIKFTIGYYSGKGKPTAKSTTGPAIYEDGGALSVTVGSSHDLSVSKETKGPTVGENWNFISFGFSLGSKTVAGGSAGVSYSTPVIYLFKENNTQETNNKNNEKPEKIKENDNDAGNVGIQF